MALGYQAASISRKKSNFNLDNKAEFKRKKLQTYNFLQEISRIDQTRNKSAEFTPYLP